MNIPIIELSSLAGMDGTAGVFGSTAQSTSSYDDMVVAIMVYLYDTLPPDALT